MGVLVGGGEVVVVVVVVFEFVYVGNGLVVFGGVFEGCFEGFYYVLFVGFIDDGYVYVGVVVYWGYVYYVFEVVVYVVC